MAKTTSDKVMNAADTVKPYVDRALHDEELRDSVRTAYESARSIYDELVGRRGMTGVATRVARDREIQDELRTAVEELRHAAGRLQGRRKAAAKAERGGRNALLLLVGIALGVLFNPITGRQTRKFLSDRVSGGGDDFTYQGGNGSPGAS